MLGLIIKDIYALKKQGKLLLVFAVIYSILSFSMKETSFVSVFMVMLCTMLTITSFSYDEVAKWNKYALSMPLHRSEIVLAKYILAFFLIVLGAASSFLCSYIVSVVLQIPFDLFEQLITSSTFGSLGLMILSIAMPFIYKLGAEKSRYVLMIIVLIPTVIVMLFSKSGLQPPSEDQVKMMMYVAPVFAIGVALISYLFSCKIFNNKEF